MAKYNGWTNYETWKANLEYFDGEEPSWLNDEILECYEDGKWNKDALEDVISTYADSLEYIFNDIYEDIDNTFVQSVFNAYMSEVNYNEIAENIIDDYKETLI